MHHTFQLVHHATLVAARQAKENPDLDALSVAKKAAHCLRSSVNPAHYQPNDDELENVVHGLGILVEGVRACPNRSTTSVVGSFVLVCHHVAIIRNLAISSVSTSKKDPPGKAKRISDDYNTTYHRLKSILHRLGAAGWQVRMNPSGPVLWVEFDLFRVNGPTKGYRYYL